MYEDYLSHHGCPDCGRDMCECGDYLSSSRFEPMRRPGRGQRRISLRGMYDARLQYLVCLEPDLLETGDLFGLSRRIFSRLQQQQEEKRQRRAAARKADRRQTRHRRRFWDSHWRSDEPIGDDCTVSDTLLQEGSDEPIADEDATRDWTDLYSHRTDGVWRLWVGAETPLCSVRAENPWKGAGNDRDDDVYTPQYWGYTHHNRDCGCVPDFSDEEGEQGYYCHRCGGER